MITLICPPAPAPESARTAFADMPYPLPSLVIVTPSTTPPVWDTVAVAVAPWKNCDPDPADVKDSAVPALAFDKEEATLILLAST